MCPGVDLASKNEYKINPRDKGGRCVRLKTYHLHVPISRNLVALSSRNAVGPVLVCNGRPLPLPIYIYIYIYMYGACVEF
jgi:hypothetical protein